MVNYKQFEKTDDVAFNIYTALLYCKANNEDGLVFDKGEYHIYAEKACEGVFSMSNHTDPGFKRCCFLIDGFENFTIDGGGSDFIFEDIMTPVIVSNSKNVTVKNFEFTSVKYLTAQFDVVKGGDESIEMKPTHGVTYVHGGDLFEGEFNSENQRLRYMDFHDNDGKISAGPSEFFTAGIEGSEYRVVFTDLHNGTYKAENIPAPLKAGQKIVMGSRTRRAAIIFLNASVNTKIKNVTVYSGLGMGIIAQNCDCVDIEEFNTRCKDGRCYSINADGTHFVHCKGDINLRNCYFEGQLDDALNIHSIYLKIVAKTENSILLKEVHSEQTGIDILSPGSVLQTADPETLLPNGEYRVKDVKRVNLEIMEVYLDEDISDIRIGDVADEISWVPDVLFENCTVVNNRARGMLLASAGKITIRKNLFKTPGPAIKFESDGKYWYESGRTKDVLITGNTFDNCKYSGWGDSVIVVMPREKTEENRYYHKKIAVVDNEFKNCKGYLANADNTETFIFKGNHITGEECVPYKTTHCKNVDAD